LAFLVLIELLGGNKVVDGNARVVSNDSIGFDGGGQLLVEVADVPVKMSARNASTGNLAETHLLSSFRYGL
jgi:hypothetical protein